MYSKFVSALLILALSAAGLQAQVSTYFGDANSIPRDLSAANVARTSFLNSFVASGTDNVESYFGYMGVPDPFPPSPGLTNLGYGVTATTNTAFVAHDPFGFYPTSGNQFLVANFFGNNVFTFNQPINGFGLFLIQSGDGSNVNSFQVSLQLGAGPVRTYPINGNADGTGVGNGTGSPLSFGPGRADNNAFFFGIRDTDAFDSFTIVAAVNTGADGVLYDDLSVGFIAAVPEPTTYALMGCIIAGAGGWYARQRKARKQLEAKKFRRQ